MLAFFRKYPIIAARHLLNRDAEPLDLQPVQQLIIQEWWYHNMNVLTASRGAGKAVDNNTKVLTPAGFVKISELRKGDNVITPDGSFSNITGVFPQGKLQLYEVEFHDGRVVKCCAQHLWEVKGCNYSNTWEVLTLANIHEWLTTKSETAHLTVRVPLVENVCLSLDKELPIHPYVLGALIGDGNYTHNHVAFSTKDAFLLDKLQQLLPEDVRLVYNSKYDYYLRGVDDEGRCYIRRVLENLGCIGQRAWEKKIPEEYMDLSRKQTLELLQGLLDTDGTSDNQTKNRVSFSTTSMVLAEQVQQLIWKLGGMCKLSSRITSYTYNGKKREGRTSYRLYIRYKNKRELFSLPRKLDNLDSKDQYSDQLALKIKRISPADVSEATCIKISDPRGLFIVDNYVVTHNTFLAAVYTALKLMLYPSSRIGCFGPSFRQSKLIFDEFSLLYDESPLLQECISKRPTASNDQAVCVLKSAGRGIRPSSLMALPVGTEGKKIRGKRFTEFFLDECAQLPENVFRSVIRPMISTDINPAKAVREMKRLREKYGDNIPEGLAGGNSGYTVITSGYYQFNYWWKEILRVWQNIHAGSKSHSMRFVPYYDLPDGFLKAEVIKEALENDPKHVFLTEWCADWIADSEGAFPMSLLEACRDTSVIPKAARDKTTDKGKDFIFGVDVARDRDSTAIVVVELGHPCKVVHISEMENTVWPQQAKHVFDLVYRFNPKRIYMDAFGGGSTLKDLLAQPELFGISTSMKIIPIDENIYHPGKRILVMCVPNPEFAEDANNSTKTLLEQGALRLPASTNPIESIRKNTAGEGRTIDLVQELINQTASVVITPTPYTGRLKYDLPKTRNSSNIDISLDAKKKDLYSAFVLAGFGAYDLFFKVIEDKRMLEQGIIRDRRVETSKQVENMGQFPSRYTISSKGSPNLGGNKRIVPAGGIIITRGRK